MATKHDLFVYGTLLQRTGTDMFRLLSSNADFVGPAVFQGRMFKISWYPGVIESDDPLHRVHGEVYRLHHEAVLSQLDRYEGCGASFEEPTEYLRERREVSLETGEKITAWIYLYNHSVEGFEVITSGDFVGYSKEIKDEY